MEQFLLNFLPVYVHQIIYGINFLLLFIAKIFQSIYLVSLLLLFLFIGLLNNPSLFIFSEYYLSPYQKKETEDGKAQLMLK